MLKACCSSEVRFETGSGQVESCVLMLMLRKRELLAWPACRQLQAGLWWECWEGAGVCRNGREQTEKGRRMQTCREQVH